MPTAAQIAERAGYSVRSIFERFPDLTALRVAATDYSIAEARANGALRDLDADRADAHQEPGQPARQRLRALAAAMARAVVGSRPERPTCSSASA